VRMMDRYHHLWVLLLLTASKAAAAASPIRRRQNAAAATTKQDEWSDLLPSVDNNDNDDSLFADLLPMVDEDVSDNNDTTVFEEQAAATLDPTPTPTTTTTIVPTTEEPAITFCAEASNPQYNDDDLDELTCRLQNDNSTWASDLLMEAQQQQQENLRRRRQLPADEASSSQALSGECGPNCRPSCLTLLLDLDKLRLPSSSNSNNNSSITCRADELCPNRCHHQHRRSECPAAQQEQVWNEYPTCYLEQAQCLGPTVYDNVAAYYMEHAPPLLDSIEAVGLDQCTAVPPTGALYDRFRDWNVVTPMPVDCPEGDDNCFGSNSDDSSSKLYFEYCNVVHEDARCDGCGRNENCSSGGDCGVRVEPFPDGWTTFTVSAPIPFPMAAAAADDECDLPYARTTGRACFLQRVQVYYGGENSCPHCHDCPLLQLGDTLGPLEVVGFGHAVGQPCAACDVRSSKPQSAAGTALQCRDLEHCQFGVDCATGDLLGIPSFVENQCSFQDPNEQDYIPAEDEDDILFEEEGTAAPVDSSIDDNDNGDEYDTFDPTCMLTYLQAENSTSGACLSGLDAAGNPCHFCTLEAMGEVVPLCLNAGQFALADSSMTAGIQCGGDEDVYYPEINHTITDTSCILTYNVSAPSRDACWAHLDGQGQPCAYCSLTGSSVASCLSMEQAAISQSAGLTCEVEEQTEEEDATNEDDDDDDDRNATTVAGSTMVEQQQQDSSQQLLPVVFPIGAALCFALLAVALLLRAQKKRQLELAKVIRERRPPPAEEIVYMDPVELDVIDKMLAPSEDDDDEDEEEGSQTEDESVTAMENVGDEEQQNEGTIKKPEEDMGGQNSRSIRSLDQSLSMPPICDPSGQPRTTKVLDFQSASLVETPGRDEVETLFMIGQHMYTRRRSSGDL